MSSFETDIVALKAYRRENFDVCFMVCVLKLFSNLNLQMLSRNHIELSSHNRNEQIKCDKNYYSEVFRVNETDSNCYDS